MSFVLLGILNSQAAGGGVFPAHFISFDFTNNIPTEGIVYANGSYWVYGEGQSSAFNNEVVPALFKINSEFQLESSFFFGQNAGGQSASERAITIDPNDTTNHVRIFSRDFRYSPEAVVHTSFNASGVMQYSEVANSSSYLNFDSFGEATVSSTGNSLKPVTFRGTDYYGGLVEYASNGTVASVREMGLGAFAQAYGITESTGGNRIIAGYQYGSNRSKPMLVKLNSSNTAVWARELSISGSMVARTVVSDNSENYYFGAEGTGNQSTDAGQVFKLASNGATVWAKYIEGSGGVSFESSAIDADGNIYMGGEGNAPGSSQRNAYLTKWDQNGNLIWQRMFKSGPGNQGLRLIGFNDNNQLAIAIDEMPGGNGPDVIVYPLDGSVTGTFNNGIATVEILDPAFTVNTASYSGTSPGIQVSNSSLTNQGNSGYTTSSFTPTVYSEGIG